MKLPPFPVDFLSRSDEVVGEALLGWWIGFQLERRGFDVSNLPQDLAERVTAATQPLESDEVRNMPLARALSLSARGEFARAGKMLRQIVLNGANDLVRDQAADLGRKIRKQRREYSKRGNAKKALESTRRREKWRSKGVPIRVKNPHKSNAWLAKEIARLTGDNPNSIRVAIPSMGLSKKTAKKT
jgi:hypothetical protein